MTVPKSREVGMISEGNGSKIRTINRIIPVHNVKRVCIHTSEERGARRAYSHRAPAQANHDKRESRKHPRAMYGRCRHQDVCVACVQFIQAYKGASLEMKFVGGAVVEFGAGPRKLRDWVRRFFERTSCSHTATYLACGCIVSLRSGFSHLSKEKKGLRRPSLKTFFPSLFSFKWWCHFLRQAQRKQRRPIFCPKIVNHVVHVSGDCP